MSRRCFSPKVEPHSHLLPLASPWDHAFLGRSPVLERYMSLHRGQCNLPLVFALGSSMKLPGPTTSNHPQCSPPQKSITAPYLLLTAALCTLDFVAGALHVGGSGHCQITLLHLQTPGVRCNHLWWEWRVSENPVLGGVQSSNRGSVRTACKHWDASHVPQET